MDAKRKTELRRRRHRRLRKKITGTAERPRVAVFKSLRHFYAQAIDDTVGHTLAAASSHLPDLRGGNGDLATAKAVGELFAAKMKEAGISRVVFDHGGFGYRGKVRVFAETLRKHGVEF